MIPVEKYVQYCDLDGWSFGEMNYMLLKSSVVDPNTFYLDPCPEMDPGIWPNLDPYPDHDPGLTYQFLKKT